MRIAKYSYIILIAGLLYSCGKIEVLPPVPSVEFTSFEVFDTTDILGNDSKGGRLKFYFEDGDGDLGLKPPALSSDIDTNNLFFSLYRKTGGTIIPAPDNDPLKPSAYRIPYMERTGQNKILRGTVSVTFLYLFYTESDTIKYDFYVEDRAGNVSNLESTSLIVLNNNGIYYKE